MPRLAALCRPLQRPIAGRGRRPPAREAGFSLIELSVVLVLLTIVLGLGLGALNAQFQSASASVTKKRQETIREALIAHLGAARRLPCADDPGTGGVTGVEQCPTTFGVLPYATLGLSRESAEDGWGNLFSYAVFAAPPAACPGPGIDWKEANCFGEGKNGGFIVKDGSIAAATDLTTGAIAVIVSHGANGLGAWTREATRNASPAGCEEEAHNSVQADCTLSANTFYRGERADIDDVVAYLNAGEAITQLARQGVVKSAPGRMAEDMQAALDTALGKVVSSGSCGVYTIALPATTDPWGHAYIGDTVDTSDPSIVYQVASAGCPTCSPAVAATTRDITKTRLNAQLANAGAGFSCP